MLWESLPWSCLLSLHLLEQREDIFHISVYFFLCLPSCAYMHSLKFWKYCFWSIFANLFETSLTQIEKANNDKMSKINLGSHHGILSNRSFQSPGWGRCSESGFITCSSKGEREKIIFSSKIFIMCSYCVCVCVMYIYTYPCFPNRNFTEISTWLYVTLNSH